MVYGAPCRISVSKSYYLLSCNFQAFRRELDNYYASVQSAHSSSFVTAEDTWVLEQKLHNINYRYRRLLSTLQFKGNLIHESLQKHQDHTAKVEAFLPWLSDAERKVAYQSQEVWNIDRDEILNKLEFTKVRATIFWGIVVGRYARTVLSLQRVLAFQVLGGVLSILREFSQHFLGVN